MIGTSGAEYIFIRTCIIFLHNVAPVSLLYCVHLLLYLFLSPSFHIYRCPLAIEIWLIAEAVFYIVVFLPQRYHHQRSAIYQHQMSRDERQTLFSRCYNNIADPERFLSRWLMVPEAGQIKRENVKDWIRWAFFGVGQTQGHDEEEIEAFTKDTEKLLGRKFSPGRSDAKNVGRILNETEGLRRSLLWYTCIFVVDTKVCCTMLYNGFHLHRTALLGFFTLFPFRPLTLFSTYRSPAKHLTYWHRKHTSKTRLPVLFIHGIGVGLYPYTNFLRELIKSGSSARAKDGEIGIIALEIMPISSRITHPAMEKDAMVGEIHKIVKQHGWDRFVLACHSYGSTIATHLLKSTLTAPLVGPIIFIDPISFLLHLPNVAYNFTARQPVHANEHQLWYFGSKDMGVAHTLARRFSWSQNIIWKEDLEVEGKDNNDSKRKVTVMLSGKDLIVDTEAVGQYLMNSSSGEDTVAPAEDAGTWKNRPWTGTGLEVVWHEKLDHAQVFDSEKTRRGLVNAINVYSSID